MTDYNAVAADFFKKYDGDSDGTLNLPEFTQLFNDLKAARPDLELEKYTAEQLFNMIDKDQDGTINPSELAAHLESQNFKPWKSLIHEV